MMNINPLQKIIAPITTLCTCALALGIMYGAHMLASTFWGSYAGESAALIAGCVIIGTISWLLRDIKKGFKDLILWVFLIFIISVIHLFAPINGIVIAPMLFSQGVLVVIAVSYFSSYALMKTVSKP